MQHDAGVAKRGTFDRVLGREARAHQQIAGLAHRNVGSQMRADRGGVRVEQVDKISVAAGKLLDHSRAALR